MKLGILLLLLTITLLPLRAQDVQVYGSAKPKVDTSYIEDFSHMLVVRAFSKVKANKLTIEDKVSNRSLILKPNVTSSLGGGFNYRWLGVDLAFRLPTSDAKNKQFGETKAFDFQANMYLRKFAIDIHWLKYTGYYIDNSVDYGKEGDKLTNASLTSGAMAISGNYIFNHKRFSYRAAFLQNERQRKSAGSFLLGVYASRNVIDSDSALIPRRYWQFFAEDALIDRGSFVQFGAQLGYAYTLVIKKFFVTASLGLGLGAQSTTTHSVITKEKTTTHQGSSKGQFRGAIGYNGDRFSMGVQGVNDTYILTGKKNIETKYDVGSIRFFLSYRFNAPGILTKITEIF